jgi:hypothetical protein
VITVNYPWVSALTVRTAYLETVRKFAGDGSRAQPQLPARVLTALHQFVEDTPGLTWGERWKAWRAKYPEWTDRYRNSAAMRASYHGAKARQPKPHEGYITFTSEA